MLSSHSTLRLLLESSLLHLEKIPKFESTLPLAVTVRSQRRVTGSAVVLKVVLLPMMSSFKSRVNGRKGSGELSPFSLSSPLSTITVRLGLARTRSYTLQSSIHCSEIRFRLPTVTSTSVLSFPSTDQPARPLAASVAPLKTSNSYSYPYR